MNNQMNQNNATRERKSTKQGMVPPKLLQKFYQEAFDPEDLLSIIGVSDFYRREFAFLLEDGGFIRNISFRSSEDLVSFLVTNPVRRAYVGAVYEVPPTKTDSIQKINWLYREFCFDIDLNEYDPVRVCGCRGAEQLCDNCWSLVQDAGAFLDKTLREDFGFKDIVWVFSGRRGIHAWVKDATASHLNQEQRIGIVSYLSLIKDEMRTQAVEKDLSKIIPFRDRIIEVIAKSFFQRANDKDLRARTKPFKLTGDKIEQLRINLRESRRPFQETYNNLFSEKKHDRDKIFTHIITHRYPRIDRKVSIDTRRILKVPGSVQDTNGKICCPIDIKKIYSFFPHDAPTIWDKVS